MMKGFITTKSAIPEQYAEIIADYYSSCGSEFTLSTYVEAIRFMTFEALGMAHSCCNPSSLVEEGAAWIDMDDLEVIEEHDFLLKLHELLVVEFTQKASEYLGNGPNDIPLFPQFWKSYWADRMTDELEKLGGEDLTAEERRDAEEIGVIWDKSTGSGERKSRNPYHRRDMEHYFFELDLICPEYNEPWPEGMRRIH
ncbi:hypothetical protein CTAM01_03357 [Colletotrichum tamarilloi]|uniref:Uncharacterized protein n=1 Tax=Colletotrichum tamarilloi TaxID=1209934 RepID=A0ABQ9RJX0_9PEZI|nr:uncharacterized protein CTAM01_03357 [Colletotrichum tamarilloi]KAK1506022.1 hypothetical protein CTAM01_03357 [Colletotrichum tamarilloi]